MNKFVVVGSGLAGSITARVLQRAGHSVVIIDDRDPHSASEASSNLYIASWLKRFQSQGARRGIDVLESLGLPTDRVFDRGIADAMSVNHIAQRDILCTPNALGTVNHVQHNGVAWTEQSTGSEMFEPGIPVLCCGHRGADLAPSLRGRIDVKVGHAFFLRGELAEGESSLQIVSPYTHGKLYQFAPGVVYYADSVALKLGSFQKRQSELKDRTIARMEKALGRFMPILDYKVGYRPLVKGFDFGVCERTEEGAFVINGGGKNGMVAYANAAARLLEQV